MCGAITQKQSVTAHSDFMFFFSSSSFFPLYSLYFNRFRRSERSRMASLEFKQAFFFFFFLNIKTDLLF